MSLSDLWNEELSEMHLPRVEEEERLIYVVSITTK